jgi:hypothetical protein
MPELSRRSVPGVHVNAQDDNYRTALWYAVSRGHEEAAQLLLRSGGDITVADMFGMTPPSNREGPCIHSQNAPESLCHDDCDTSDGGRWRP